MALGEPGDTLVVPLPPRGQLSPNHAGIELKSVSGRGLSWWLSSKESAYQCRRLGFDPWVDKIPLEDSP